MPKINVLDEETINKIAAGEVVERPVSVIKELVENAIDAGSHNISIEIKGGGIDYIRVTDNGSGIQKDNIPLAFMRHATSKIKSIEDLACATSLGFRGEALSSIAAVSQVELMTKTSEDVLGYRYVINGGKEMSFDEAGVPDGTTMIVRNLFYNTPARKKFLKSAVTEANYITELIERIVLSHPDISFKYVNNGTLKISSNGMSDVRSDIYTVFGKDIVNALVPVEYEDENMKITGYVCKSEIARGNRNYELFFVNNRLIRSKVLSSATEEAYKPYLMLHKFPFVILYIDIDPALLDVNVHPAKTEIRFLNERDIYNAVLSTVTDGITKKELIPEVNVANETNSIPESKTEKAFIPEPFMIKSIKKVSEDIRTDNIKKTLKKEVEPVQETLFKEGFLGEENRAKHKIVGQVFDTYWIIEYDGKMYIVDQHAAHEKVLYERFKKTILESSVSSQIISPPFIMSLSVSQEETLKHNLSSFTEIGFQVEHFGGREYALSAVPTQLFGMNEKEYFTTLLDELSAERSKSEPYAVKLRIATMACKAAVKGNMRMSVREADALIDEMLTLENPYNCPHGRPTVVSFSRTELEKMFKRIV